MTSAIPPQTNFTTIVTSGASQSHATAQGQLFSRDPVSVTSFSGQEIQDTFVFSPPATENLSPDLRAADFGTRSTANTGFRALSSQEQSDAKRIMKDLNKNARLFARNEQGELVRITPANGKQRLDAGEAIEVVTQLGLENRSSESSSSSSYFKTKFFSSADRYSSSSDTTSSETRANYTSSPLTEWDSLLWHDGEEGLRGIPGTPKLPPSGQPVTISRSWEKSWNVQSETHSGFLGRRVEVDQSSGFHRVDQRA